MSADSRPALARLRPFKAASPSFLRAYYPDFPGPAGVYALQHHLIGKVFWPLLDRYLGPDDLLLDLGCGTGWLVKKLSAKGKSAIGLDANDSDFGKYPEVTSKLMKGDIYDLPLDAGTVDLVTSRWVFEHLDDPAAAVAEIARVLKPAGRALIIVPNALHPGMVLSRVASTVLKQRALHRLTGVEERSVLETHYRINTEPALDRAFGSAGFEKLELVHCSDPSYWVFSRRLFRCAVVANRLTSRLPLRRFRMHIVAVYRKATLPPLAS